MINHFVFQVGLELAVYLRMTLNLRSCFHLLHAGITVCACTLALYGTRDWAQNCVQGRWMLYQFQTCVHPLIFVVPWFPLLFLLQPSLLSVLVPLSPPYSLGLQFYLSLAGTTGILCSGCFRNVTSSCICHEAQVGVPVWEWQDRNRSTKMLTQFYLVSECKSNWINAGGCPLKKKMAPSNWKRKYQ